MLDTMKLLLKEGGVNGLWRGNGINVLKIAPESAIKFGAYDMLKKMVRGNTDRELQLYERFICGSLAGGISQTIIYPLEVLTKYFPQLQTRERVRIKCILDTITIFLIGNENKTCSSENRRIHWHL